MRRSFPIRLGAGVFLAFAVSGCGGYISQLPVVGPGTIPPPPDVRPEYPSVSTKRVVDAKPMTAAERAAERLKLEAELVAARTGSVAQRRLSISQPATPPAAPVTPAPVTPAPTPAPAQ